MTDKPHPQSTVAIRDAATVVVLRDDGGALEVLLLRRHHRHVFGAEADVFPGGAVDAADIELTRAAGLPDGAARMAGLRECFEEAGLLFAAPAIDAGLSSAWRAELNGGRSDWAGVIAALGLRLNLLAPLAFASWTTPPGRPRRYATRFYAITAPAGQIASADGRETVAAEWVRPKAALAEADAGRRWLMTPTRATLERLTYYGDTASALAGLAWGNRHDRVQRADR